MSLRMNTSKHGRRCGASLLALIAALAMAFPALGGGRPRDGGLPADLDAALRTCVETAGVESIVVSAWRDAVQAAVRAGEDPGLLEELLRRGCDEGLGTDEIGGILSRVERLVNQGVPIELVIDRILQGIAKGVPFSRIEAVAESVERNLLEASNTVDGIYPPADPDTLRHERRVLINQAVYALNAGAAPTELEQALRLSSDDGSSMEDAGAVAISMGCLLSAGLDPAQSYRFVETAWRHGYRGPVMIELGKAVAMFGDPGNPPPEQLVEGLLHQIRRQAEAGDIFQDLEKAHAAGDFHPSDIDPTGVAAPEHGAEQFIDDGREGTDVTSPPDAPEDPEDPDDP